MLAVSGGCELWRGPSEIDGQEIVALLSWSSRNVKTGPIPQLWILPADVQPSAAVKTGADVSVCGGCTARPAAGGFCYVVAFHGPDAVWKAWKRGRYPVVPAVTLQGRVAGARAVRFGAWGDPGALPLEAVEPLLEACRDYGVTPIGYTQRWRSTEWARGILQASCYTPADALRARSKGWATFRVLADGDRPDVSEAPCTFAEDAIQCTACRACDGSQSITVPVHGAPRKLRGFARFRARLARRSA